VADIVVIGAGHAGIQLVDSLRAEGFSGAIALFEAQLGVPYQRPPLSKEFMAADPASTENSAEHGVMLRGPGFLVDMEVDFRPGRAVSSVDRVARELVLTDESRFGYRRLVFATGATNRALTVPGADLGGVIGLKTLTDAEELRRRLRQADQVVVIGAGFIGLEFAAVARASGCAVTVIEFNDRPMKRALSATTGNYFAAAHRSRGIELLLGEAVESLVGDASVVTGVRTASGKSIPADLVVVGVGVTPADGLARAAGLEIDNGISVDEMLATSDPAIFAVGDCASYPMAATGDRVRLESVQNATEHARTLARVLCGRGSAYEAVPWFWSVQGGIRLQIAGLAAPGDVEVMLGNPDEAQFSVLLFRSDRLVAVESVNRAADHVAARRILAPDAACGRLTVAEVTGPAFNLKQFSRSVMATA
jgi:3-phenylpropionate/trans-cinnamate dioxygenase ferredoxin reductase subunit